MQKKLIALAIAGLSSAAFAQTNVTIYGVADVTVDVASANGATGAGANVQSRSRVNSNSSLLGFKGTEDLGDGLKAIFQFETGINTDGTAAGKTGTTSAFGAPAGGGAIVGGQRDTYVGLSGSFGTVKGGYMSTPVRNMVRGFDPIPGSTGIAEVGGVFATAPGLFNGGSFLFRSQGVSYTTPDFGNNFDATVFYSGQESKSVAGGVDPAVKSVGLNYKVGGLKLGYSYIGLDDSGFVGLTSESIKAHFIGASYDFGQGTSLAGQYEDAKNEVPLGDLTLKAYWLALNHVDGANVYTATYGHAADTKGSLGASGTGAKQVSLRYARILSKRTQVYGVFSEIINDTAGLYDFNTNAVGGFGAGADPKALAFGVRHSF